jgi:hypothetical protein
VAHQAQQAASTAAGKVQAKATSTATKAADSPTVTATVTQPTKTVTVPGQSSTVTETRTVTPPSHTTSITGQTTSVHVAPAAQGDNESGEGVPTWGWLLIGLGVVGIAIAMFLVGRGRRRDDGGATPKTQPAQGGADPGGPPPGG